LELPHNSSSLKGNVYFAIRSKKEWQNSPRLFCRFGHYFALVGKIDSISLTFECSCILCPNVENFCPNIGCDRIPCIPMPYAYDSNWYATNI